MIKKLYIFFGVVLLAGALMFSGCEKKDKISTLNKEKVENISLSKEDKDNFVSIDLYFNADNNKDKVEVAKEPRIMNKKELLSEVMIEELIKGPSPESKLTPIFSKETKVLNVSIKEGIAYVNLSKEAKITTDKSKELACLKSIVYSLTSLEPIDKVKILIENRNVDTLGGNYNISKPIGREEVDLLR